MYWITLYVCIIWMVFSDRIGDYNYYQFETTDKLEGGVDWKGNFPRFCRIEGCKATGEGKSMCNDNKSARDIIGKASWELTQVCNANRRVQAFLGNSLEKSNNLTWDILLATDQCALTDLGTSAGSGLAYTKECGNLHDLNSNKLHWAESTSGDNCRFCPLCTCDWSTSNDKPYFWNDGIWDFDPTKFVPIRQCVKCSCINITDGLFPKEGSSPDAKDIELAGWRCKIQWTKDTFTETQNGVWYCDGVTDRPTINPTTNPTREPVMPTVHPTINPTVSPTYSCPVGNNAPINITSSDVNYYFDPTDNTCDTFCKCMPSGSYCKTGYRTIANDPELMHGFYTKCGKYMTECYSGNGTTDLFVLTSYKNYTCSGNVNHNVPSYGSGFETNYWATYCPRCPCSYTNHDVNDEWKGAYKDGKTFSTSTNSSTSTYRCVKDFRCLGTNYKNETFATQPYAIVPDSASDTNPTNDSSYVQCYTDPNICLTGYPNTWTSTEYDSGVFDSCYWRNLTTNPSNTVCLVDGSNNQPKYQADTYGHITNWKCEAFLNNSGNTNGKACWNQAISWKAETFNCYTLQWETEMITTTVRLSCCTANSKYACNNQTIREGSKNCGNSPLVGKYFKKYFERQYGNNGKWTTETAAYLKCGVKPGKNRSIEETLINGPNAAKNGCAWLKSYYLSKTSEWCDRRKVLEDSGSLSFTNAQKMWTDDYSTIFDFWTSASGYFDRRQWYSHWNCSFYDPFTSTRTYDYPPKKYFSSGPTYPCLDFGDSDSVDRNYYKLPIITFIIAITYIMIN